MKPWPWQDERQTFKRVEVTKFEGDEEKKEKKEEKEKKKKRKRKRKRKKDPSLKEVPCNILEGWSRLDPAG